MTSYLTCMDIHIHSNWSDGEEFPEAIAENASRLQVGIAGICDHFGAKDTKSVAPNELGGYIDAIAAIKNKSGLETKVLAGAEIPAGAVLRGIDDESRRLIKALDYILIEDSERLREADFNRLLARLGNLCCKVGLAHCNLTEMQRNTGLPLEGILRQLGRLGIFWEINAGAQHGFFDDAIDYRPGRNPETDLWFDKLAEYRIKVAAGSDSHQLDGYPIGRLRQANRVISERLAPMEF